MKTLPHRVAWYGKLPARGDFVGRGLPPRWRSDWDTWLQRGLALAAATLPDGSLREHLGGFAPWRYVALPAPGEIWCGILVASHDRVGRAFPLTLAERVSVLPPPEEGAARLVSLLGPAAEGPEALEAAISALPPPSDGESKAARTWPRQPASLWWPLAAGQDELPRTAGWPPEPALLLELLAIQAQSTGAEGRRGPDGRRSP